MRTALPARGIEEKNITIKLIDQRKRVKKGEWKSGVHLQSGEVEISIDIATYLLYKSKPVMQCRNRHCRLETPNLETRRCPKCNSSLRPKIVEEVEDEYSIPTPPILKRTLSTRAAWIDLSKSLHQQFAEEFWPRWNAPSSNGDNHKTGLPDFNSAMHSTEHAILKAFPDYKRCDQDEIGGIYQGDVDGLAGRLFIYDNFPGGLGLSDEFIYDAQTILEGGLDLIERCTCLDDEGCPICLDYFGCNQFNQSLSKLAGRYLLRSLLGESTQVVLSDLEEYVNIHVPDSQRVVGSPEK